MLKDKGLSKIEIDLKKFSRAFFDKTLSVIQEGGRTLLNTLSEYAKIDTIIVGKALNKFRLTLATTSKLKLPINI